MLQYTCKTALVLFISFYTRSDAMLDTMRYIGDDYDILTSKNAISELSGTVHLFVSVWFIIACAILMIIMFLIITLIKLASLLISGQ